MKFNCKQRISKDKMFLERKSYKWGKDGLATERTTRTPNALKINTIPQNPFTHTAFSSCAKSFIDVKSYCYE